MLLLTWLVVRNVIIYVHNMSVHVLKNMTWSIIPLHMMVTNVCNKYVQVRMCRIYRVCLVLDTQYVLDGPMLPMDIATFPLIYYNFYLQIENTVY